MDLETLNKAKQLATEIELLKFKIDLVSIAGTFKYRAANSSAEVEIPKDVIEKEEILAKLNSKLDELEEQFANL